MSINMTSERQGQIALLMMKRQLKKSGIPIDNLKRELGNAAADIGVDVEEVVVLYEAIIPELLAHALGRESVSLVTSDEQ